jgi:catechol 2,3-dioxygenase-like lactoylglutathione lyase family enzyme
MTGVGRLRSVAFECSDAASLAAFWSVVLDRPIAQRDDDWWSLEPSADGTRLAFQVVDAYEPPAWPGEHGEQQVHLDIEVEQIAPAAVAVLELGAVQLSDVITEDGGGWQVFADPAGHPFCLVTTT